jgi:quinol monooxygenase YgiN
MVIVHVHAQVKPEFVEAFRAATAENARNSVLEPGILRFDVIQQEDDPTRFVLIEIYRTVEATVAHKETAHYAAWQAAVAAMMAEPRSRVRYTTVFPAEQDW